MKAPIVASIVPGAAVDEAAIPRPVTIIGSILSVSESTISTVSTLPLTVADAPSDPGDFAVDGVPRKDTPAPVPALSESVTWNEPGPRGIAATLASLKDRLKVGADDPPRWTVPTPVTVTLANTGVAAVGCGVGVGVGVLVQAASARAAINHNRFTTPLYAHLSARHRCAPAFWRPREAVVPAVRSAVGASARAFVAGSPPVISG